ncbi:MAG: dipeptidase [Nocardiopsaceae bacterium]|nr:dipeptidase [Nocardiopsaceae bacterium]
MLGRFPLIDGHNDLPWEIRVQFGQDPVRARLDQRLDSTHTDIPRLTEGGVGGQFWSVYVPGTLGPGEAVATVLEEIDIVHRMVAAYPDRFRLALTADDVTSAFGDGKIASLLGAEGGHSIGGSLGVLRTLHRLGVRYMTLTHNQNTGWADSATDEPDAGGLSDFGREVVREMQRLGMLVDLSHTAPSTMRDALETARAPVIFSHSSARALNDHPRNVPDDVLAGLAANGGVCMVTFVPAFVSADPDAATVAVVADHVEHVRAVAGLRHVGLGGDYDGTSVLAAGLEDVSRYPALFAELLRRGWTSDDCAALAGGNVLRVLRAAEAVAVARANTGA